MFTWPFDLDQAPVGSQRLVSPSPRRGEGGLRQSGSHVEVSQAGGSTDSALDFGVLNWGEGKGGGMGCPDLCRKVQIHEPLLSTYPDKEREKVRLHPEEGRTAGVPRMRGSGDR